MALETGLVRPDRGPLERLLPARGVRLRRRHAAPGAAPRRARAGHHVRVDRAGLGRQRGVAGGRRRRDVRRLPGLVRDDVLGLLPRPAADPRAADRPGGLVRVAREARRRRAGAATWLWANTIGSVGASFLWGVALANLVHGVPLDSSHEFTGNVLDLFSPYTVVAGLAVVAMFAAARRDLPDPAHDRRPAPARRRDRAAAAVPAAVARRRRRRLDGRGRPRQQRPGGAADGDPGRARPRPC